MESDLGRRYRDQVFGPIVHHLYSIPTGKEWERPKSWYGKEPRDETWPLAVVEEPLEPNKDG